MIKQILILLTAVLLAGCNSQSKDAREFEDALEAEFGVGFSRVKTYTLTSGYSVFQNDVTGEYIAFNLDKFDRDSDTYATYILKTNETDVRGSLNRYQQWEQDLESRSVTDYRYEWVERYDAFSDSYYDSWEYVPYTYTEYYYVDVLRTYYTDGIYTFQVGQNMGKDLEKIGGLVEEQTLNELGSFFSGQYGLSEDRGIEVAKLVQSYDQISQNRSMTDADKKAFETELLGTDLATFEKAYQNSKKGVDQNKFNSLIDKASKLNEVSPEHFMTIMGDIIR